MGGCTVDDKVILSSFNVVFLLKTNIYRLREWLRLLNGKDEMMYLNDVTGTIVEYVTKKGILLALHGKYILKITQEKSE